jgi:hypothetical protein
MTQAVLRTLRTQRRPMSAQPISWYSGVAPTADDSRTVGCALRRPRVTSGASKARSAW